MKADSSSEHAVVIIHSQSVHWTASDSFKYCPQPLLHLSVFILIHISRLLFAHLTSSCFLPSPLPSYVIVVTLFCIHSIVPPPPNIYLIPGITPHPFLVLFIHSVSLQSSGVSCPVFHEPLIHLSLFVAPGNNGRAQTEITAEGCVSVGN